MKSFGSFIFQLLVLATLAMSVSSAWVTYGTPEQGVVTQNRGCAWPGNSMNSISGVPATSMCARVCIGVIACTHFTWTIGNVCVLYRSPGQLAVNLNAPAVFGCGFLKGRTSQTV